LSGVGIDIKRNSSNSIVSAADRDEAANMRLQHVSSTLANMSSVRWSDWEPEKIFDPTGYYRLYQRRNTSGLLEYTWRLLTEEEGEEGGLIQ
jgi:hypothetical protein